MRSIILTMSRYLPAVILALTLGLLSCLRPNAEPQVAYGRGSGHVAPGSVYEYRVVIEDRDRDSVQCAVDWGDGTPPATGEWRQSPAEYVFGHSWQELGRYRVYVTCRDNRGAEAAPFLFTWVSCESLVAPTAPTVDSTWGEEVGFVGLRYRFGARVSDPNGDKARIQFRWGDGTESEWSRWARSGDRVTLSKSWVLTGRFAVAVRAEDKTGLVSDWSPVTTIAMLAAPALRWERSLDEPGGVMPLWSGNELVVTDRGAVVRLNLQNGNLLGEYTGPGAVRHGAASEAAGVFLREESAAWGFTAGGQNWRAQVPVSGLAMALGPALLWVPERDACRLLAVADGRQQALVAVPDLNLAAPVAGPDGHWYCIGDSLRAFRADGERVGAWAAPGLLPVEFAAGPAGFAGVPLCQGCEVVVFGFDSTGVRWQQRLGVQPITETPIAPVIGPDRRVYAATRDSVFAFDRDGRRRWAWGPGAGEHVTTGTPCLGSRGNLVFGLAGEEAGALVGLDSTGRESWRVSLGTRAPLGIVLAPDSVVYGIGMDDAAAFAVYAAEPPAPDPCWPMYRHDAGQTGRVWGP
ncbi:hypothetical protein JXB37_07475 [candidate division WOR-3 bacterium]|nr:hypothetical protein [candidate division WOR-3 bacterium]